MKNPKLHVHEPVQTLPKLATLSLYQCFVFDGELYIIVDRDSNGTIKVWGLTTPCEQWYGGMLCVRPVTMTYVEVTPV